MLYIILVLILTTLIPNIQAPPKAKAKEPEAVELSDHRGPAKDSNNRATGRIPAERIARVETLPKLESISTTNTVSDTKKAKVPRKGAPGTPQSVAEIAAAETCPINAAGETMELLKPLGPNEKKKLLGVLKDIIVNLLGIDIDVLSAIDLNSAVAVSLNDGVKSTKVLQKSNLHITIGTAVASWAVGHNLFLLFTIGKGFLKGYQFLWENFPHNFVLNDEQKAKVFLKWYTCGLEQMFETRQKQGKALTYMDFAQVIGKAQFEAYGYVEKLSGNVTAMKTLSKKANKL